MKYAIEIVPTGKGRDGLLREAELTSTKLSQF